MSYAVCAAINLVCAWINFTLFIIGAGAAHGIVGALCLVGAFVCAKEAYRNGLH